MRDIDVQMYDPDALWPDGPDEITSRIARQADCIVYVGPKRPTSPWVRLEHAWARELHRNVYWHQGPDYTLGLIAEIYKASQAERHSMSGHDYVTKQDKVFRAHLPRSAVRGSQALQVNSGWSIGRDLQYEQAWDDFHQRIHNAQVAFLKCLLWCFASCAAAVCAAMMLYWRAQGLLLYGGAASCVFIMLYSTRQAVTAYRRYSKFSNPSGWKPDR